MAKRSVGKKTTSRTSSERKKTPEEAYQYARALDYTPAIVRDRPGEIKFWARNLERLYGFSPAQAVGRIAHKLLKTEFPRPLKDIDEELFDTGEWDGEVVQRKRDGKPIIVSSHWTLWRDRQNGTLITEVNNETNERERAYLASIVKSSDDAIIGKTLSGVISSWNKAAERMFGYEASEIRGKPVTLLIPADRIREEEIILERVGQGEQVDHLETIRRRKDGSEIVVSLTISPIRDRHGKIVGASKIARDISEQRAAQNRVLELQSELLHASRLGALGQMVAAITHELNQPLLAVHGYLAGLGRILSASDIPASISEAVERARDQNSRASQIIRGLADLVAKREANSRVENVNEIVEEILQVALIDAKVRGVKTRVSLAPGLKPVLVDRIQIGQVILNIVRNAMEAMEGLVRPSLTISTASEPELDGIELRIADTGPGLPLHVKERLFQPFVTTKDKGMGIGLSICHDIITSHGGTLSVEPNQPSGTVFVIRLPTGRN